MFDRWKKKRIRSEYEDATKALQLSLYEVIKSVLWDELHEEYSDEQIGAAAAILTVVVKSSPARLVTARIASAEAAAYAVPVVLIAKAKPTAMSPRLSPATAM